MLSTWHTNTPVKAYALVADDKFLINASHWMTDELLGKQIGGKINIIEDPFGKNGEPQYLGATTLIVGGAIEHLKEFESAPIFMGDGMRTRWFEAVNDEHGNGVRLDIIK